MSKTYRQALCPCCGTAHGMEVTETIPGKPYMVLARRNYWERTKDFDPNKPFGVIQEVGLGRGRSFQVLGYFSPEEDQDGFFPLVKNRLLQAVKEWRDKGWITEDEVNELCEYIPPAKPTPRQPALPIPEPSMPEATPLHEAPVPRGQQQGYHLLNIEGYSYKLKPKRGWYFKNKWIGYNASEAFKHRAMREKGLAE